MESLGNMNQERISTAINYYNHILEPPKKHITKNKEAVE
jgi:hypothetical protein